ncbi:MAG: sugar phosphate isomerase/epimerase [Calditrichaeota bacterium]|nr:sugar phosphate isomerase/epimerase [Calditrichota bacterium]
MYGISTCWRSTQITDGNRLLDAMLESGLSTLELDYRIHETEFNKIAKRLKTDEFTILTAHNIFPIPDNALSKNNSFVQPSLSSLDIDERKLAVKYGIKTIHLASDLGAKLVIFHLGKVEMNGERTKLFSFYENNKIDSKEYREFIEGKLDERMAKAPPYFDALLKSLDQLNEEAFHLGILIGAENRYSYEQIPFANEFEHIFQEFAGGNVRYWHDVGHAEISHRLKILNHENDYLKKYKKYLAGMHIHDIKGLQDHLAPGLGDFQFEILKPYLDKDSIRILEIHDQASAQNIQTAVKSLIKMELFKAEK